MGNVLELAIVLIVMAALDNRGIIMAGAQSPPSPISSSSSCGSSLVNLVACMSFLQAGAKNNKPTPACCTALASEVDTSAVCVCQMLTTTKSPLGTPINNIPQGIPINQSRALTLPGACKLSTPTLTQCMSAAVGAGAPVATPVASPLPATSSPSPAATSTIQSPAPSVYQSALPPATTSTGVLSPSGSQKVPTASSNAERMIRFSMRNMLIVGLINSIAARIFV
eukprot:PITA_22706